MLSAVGIALLAISLPGHVEVYSHRGRAASSREHAGRNRGVSSDRNGLGGHRRRPHEGRGGPRLPRSCPEPAIVRDASGKYVAPAPSSSRTSPRRAAPVRRRENRPGNRLRKALSDQVAVDGARMPTLRRWSGSSRPGAEQSRFPDRDEVGPREPAISADPERFARRSTGFSGKRRSSRG